MGSGPSRRFKDNVIVMIDIRRTGTFAGPLMFGRVTGVCASLVRNNFEYTITVEDNCTECIEEQFIRPLSLEAVDFVSSESREVAVWVETHGEKRFAANLVRRDEDMLFEVRFVADDTVLEGVSPEHLSEPNQLTLRDVSPETLAPDPLWLLDRKIQANIDMHWPIQTRIHDALQLLRIPRPAALWAFHRQKCSRFRGKTGAPSTTTRADGGWLFCGHVVEVRWKGEVCHDL